jgi:hypothetical protein
LSTAPGLDLDEGRLVVLLLFCHQVDELLKPGSFFGGFTSGNRLISGLSTKKLWTDSL